MRERRAALGFAHAGPTRSVRTLKRKLVTPPIFGLPKTNKPYMIDTDASAYQLGTTLLQKKNETKNQWTPIGYWSKKLTDTERNYSTTEDE